MTKRSSVGLRNKELTVYLPVMKKYIIPFLLTMLFFSLAGFYPTDCGTNTSNASCVNPDEPEIDVEDCSWDGFPLHGKIKFVESFPDIKIQIVNSFPDIKVKLVESFPDECGEWKIVESFPDVKVKIVESFPDIKVQFVESFPGIAP